MCLISLTSAFSTHFSYQTAVACTAVHKVPQSRGVWVGMADLCQGQHVFNRRLMMPAQTPIQVGNRYYMGPFVVSLPPFTRHNI
jgi:hypothetical protein